MPRNAKKKGPTSEYISAVGKSFDIFKILVESVLDLGGCDQSFDPILNRDSSVREIAKKIVGPIWEWEGKRVSLEIDRKSTIGDFLKAITITRFNPYCHRQIPDNLAHISPLYPAYDYALSHCPPCSVHSRQEGIPPHQVLAHYRELCTYIIQVWQLKIVGSVATVVGECIDPDARHKEFICCHIYTDGSKKISVIEHAQLAPNCFFLNRIPRS